MLATGPSDFRRPCIALLVSGVTLHPHLAKRATLLTAFHERRSASSSGYSAHFSAHSGSISSPLLRGGLNLSIHKSFWVLGRT